MNPAVQQFAVAALGAVLFFIAARLLVAGLHKGVGPALGVIRPVLSRVDAFLVLRLSVWLGLSDTVAWRRWVRLVGILVALAAAGAVAPTVLAVAPLAGGLVAVLAVFRRWVWDEEDRALGLSPDEKRAPGSEDFNEEVLAALAAVFMLTSLLVWRLTGLQAFTLEGGGLGPYLAYMASETLEALPILGNLEVLGYENPSGVDVVLPTGGWVAFALRMALDVIVIGGLLKAVEIAGRIARGQDLRREDEAIRAGQPERVRTAVATLGRLALGEDANALKRLEDLARDIDGEGYAPRFRLMALEQLDAVAAHRPLAAESIHRARYWAAHDLLTQPDLEAHGLRPAAHLQLFSAAYALFECSQGEAAIALLQEAASSLAHAMTQSGHSPLASSFLSDPPPPITPVEAAELKLRYARIKLDMADMLNGAGSLVHLKDGLRMADAAFRGLDEEETPDAWAAGWLLKGQLLVRLGQHDRTEAGSAALLEARAALAACERVRGQDTHSDDWMNLRITQGVLERQVADLLTGDEALATYQRSADLYLDAANGWISSDGSPVQIVRALLNYADVVVEVARIRAGESEPNRDLILELLDHASDRLLTALRLLDGVNRPVERAAVNRQLATVYQGKFHWSGDREALLMVAATRRGILADVDKARDPVAWARAALETCQVEHELGQDAVSDSMTRSALERLKRAREILARYQLSGELAEADELESEMTAVLARFAAAAEAGQPPDGETIH